VVSIRPCLVRRLVEQATTKDHRMKYLCFIKHAEHYRKAGPPAALLDAMGTFIAQSKRDGVLVDTGGLRPSSEGARVQLAGGKLTVIDGPFSESKEIIGGWAILQTKTRAEALRVATEFMELHRKHWPEFEGESELRPMMEPGQTP
jgi:hypothetical protein